MVIEEGATVALDTNCLIYYFENHPKYADSLEQLFTDIQDGRVVAKLSILTLLEILVKPKKDNNVFLQNRYKLVLANFPNMYIEDIDMKVVDLAASLRAKYSIKTPEQL